MFVILRLTLVLRSLSLIVAGVAIGVTLVPPGVAGTTTARIATTTYTRTASCAGMDFHPIKSNTGYDWTGTYLFQSNLAGDGYFLCDPGLPNKAVVKKVQFLVQDMDASGSVDNCALVLIGQTVALANRLAVLASVPATGGPATPGILRRTTTTIQFATVDNAKYAYWLQCQLTGTNSTSGLFGGNVTYTITAANG